MKRTTYLFPLMAMTALTLSLAACDDKKTDETATTEATTEATAQATEAAAPAAVMHAEGANAFATAEGATTGAVFLMLHNPQTAADKLVGASTPVASMVELHQSATDANGVATMTKVDSIEIPAGQQVNLEPMGYHIMLTGLTAPLAEGTSFDITLDFENAADVTLPVMVKAPAAPAADAAPAMDHSTMDHGTTTVDESPAPTEAATPVTEPAVAPAPEEAAAPAPDAPAADAPAADAPAADAPAADAPAADAQPAQ